MVEKMTIGELDIFRMLNSSTEQLYISPAIFGVVKFALGLGLAIYVLLLRVYSPSFTGEARGWYDWFTLKVSHIGMALQAVFGVILMQDGFAHPFEPRMPTTLFAFACFCIRARGLYVAFYGFSKTCHDAPPLSYSGDQF